MTAGIEIINDAGTILIDSNYKNLAISRKQSGTFGSAGGNQLLGTFQFTVPDSSEPIAAVQCASGPAFVISVTVTAGLATITAKGPPGAAVTVFVFDLPKVVSTAGLQVFNVAGELCFDSGNQYARVKDIVTGTTSAITKTYESGRSYAVAFLKRGRRQQRQFTSSGCGMGDSKNWLTRYSKNVMVASNIVSFGYAAYYDWGAYDVCEPRTYPSFVDTDFVAAVIDITGY